MIDAIVLYILILAQLTLTFIQSQRSARKQKTSAPIISHSFQLISKEFGILLRLVDVMNHILILYRPFTFQKREPYFYDFIKKVNVGLYSDNYRSICFKLCVMIEITKLSIFISVWMTLTFIQCHTYIRNQKLWCPFSHKSINLDEIQYVATTCWFVEAHAKFILHK